MEGNHFIRGPTGDRKEGARQLDRECRSRTIHTCRKGTGRNHARRAPDGCGQPAESKRAFSEIEAMTQGPGHPRITNSSFETLSRLMSWYCF